MPLYFFFGSTRVYQTRVEIKCQSDPTGQVGPSKAKYATLKITTGLKESFTTGLKESFTGLKESFTGLKDSFTGLKDSFARLKESF